MFKVRRLVTCAFCGKEIKIFLYNKNGERFKEDLPYQPRYLQWRGRGATWDTIYKHWFCNVCFKKVGSQRIMSDVFKKVTKKKLVKSERKKNGSKKNKAVATRDRQKESAN